MSQPPWNPESLADLEDSFAGRYILVKSDICDRAAMADTMDRYEVDTIAHFAAESLIPGSPPL